MHTNGSLRGFAAFFCSTLVAALAPAQTITVTPGGSLVAGQTATIRYANPSLANQEVVIEVSGGFPVPIYESVRIKLGPDGEGSGDWTVASWRNARFNGPGAAEVVAPIK